MRDSLDGAAQPMLGSIFRFLSRWHLAKGRQVVARYLAGTMAMDDAASSLRRFLIRYERFQILSMSRLPSGTGILEAFSLMPDGSSEIDARVWQLIERGEELEVGSVEYQRRREQRERAHMEDQRRRAQSDESGGAV